MTPILTNEEVNRIFANVEVILKLSEELLVSLKERLNNWNNQQQIGDVFLKFVSFFKIYSHYTENYERSVEFIKEKTKENPQFVTFLDVCQFLKLILFHACRFQSLTKFCSCLHFISLLVNRRHTQSLIKKHLKIRVEAN
jgi:hypothetical protein